MAASKRKSIVDTSEFSKRAKLWFTGGLDGLSSYLKLMPLDKLVGEHQPKKRGWVGAYPGLSDQQDSYYIRGVLLKDDANQGQFLPGRHGASAASTNKSNVEEDSKPYQLEPYTKAPTFITVPDPQESSSSRSLSPSPLTYGRSSGSDSADSSRRESSSHSPTSRSHPFQPFSRFGAMNYNRFEQSSLLRARPRIYAGKAQRTTSLLQSKYYKDETLARQRLFERHNQAHPKPELNRLKEALDATIGTLKSERESYINSRGNLTPSIEEEIAEHRRNRAYNRANNSRDDWEFEKSTVSRQPAWLSTKYQGNREPTWLKNFRNLINRNLPSVEQQPRPPGHQAIVDKHERIEKELAARKQKDQFTPIAKDDEDRIKEALSDGYPNCVVAEGFNVSLLKKDVQTLRPGEWLNDEVINFYGNLIMARSKESTTLPKVKVFEMDYVLVPIHHSGNHWTTAVIDMKNKCIEYYDSLLGNNPKCFLILRNYLEQESQDKLKKSFDSQGWENLCPKDIPRQRNGFDCGVFTCTFIEFRSRGMDNLDFSQDNMSYLRKRIVLSLINKSL
ncbi:SUMO1 sentrin specific peptidase 1 [Modicella reniformis]|uniref:SUMO1 sentrin specific peptidase 1 n=1 Tax=Modicella reniformis TaxID=1440133 RepID=A0A9P6MI20_9FUNG|nr:SUMO1 sentrin specific peptidase 1 [Modicella reniformis]